MRRIATTGDESRKKIISRRYPASRQQRRRESSVLPLRVVSNAKSSRAVASLSISATNTLPAATAASEGRRGESPAAIRSAFTKCMTPASIGRNSRANVVLPEPLGPAITIHRGGWRRELTFFNPVPLDLLDGSSPTDSGNRSRCQVLHAVRSAPLATGPCIRQPGRVAHQSDPRARKHRQSNSAIAGLSTRYCGRPVASTTVKVCVSTPRL